MNFDAAATPLDILGTTSAALDALDFGVVVMDPGGTVRYYNAFESRLSGYAPDQVIGRDFFVGVAPCTNNYLVREQYFEEAPIDRTIHYFFSFKMKPTPVRLRMATWTDGPWLLLVQPGK